MKSIRALPLVSVIIPTYNRELMVGSAIESALGQTYENIEVIVIDDGSTDGTRALVEKYSGVKYILKENGGQASARNSGLSQATGSYIASLDSDDTWKPDFLERCILKLEQDQLDFVFTNWLQMVDDDQGYDFFLDTCRLTGYKICTGSWTNLGQKELRSLYLKDCPSPSSSLVIRRSSMKLGWNENMHIGDDWCLLLDMILSPDCNAAFTMDRLWVKKTDGNNVFDGCNPYKVLQLLNIDDRESMIERYAGVLTDRELDFLRQELAVNMYRLVIHKFLKRIDFAVNLKMFKKAGGINRYLFFSVLYGKVRFAVKRNIRPEIWAPDLIPNSVVTRESGSLVFSARSASAFD